MPISATPPDISVLTQHIVVSRSLATAMNLSLLTWARANPDDDIPDQSDLKGWWGDTYPDVPGDRFGSLLWTLWGISPAVAAARAPDIVQTALAWLIEDGHAEAFEVTAEVLGRAAIGIAITPTLPTGIRAPQLGPWVLTVG